SIVNDGTVTVGTLGHPATLDIGGAVTLLRGGNLMLSDDAGNAILSNGAAATLTNVRNTISGAGTIGDANLSLVNQSSGVIAATGANPLVIAGASLDNAGTLAVSAGARMILDTPVTDIGRDLIGAGGTLEFGGPVSGQTVAFTA